ncbi:hypothetical protein WJX74_001892 [Apatococcus lobatus]|uniref:Mitochondrial import inner membrane translocase subunit n=1 Tax=Apatococcus lobatus TaxID=904363 RepID=A0AAW1RBT8_9CHLO
MDFGSPSSSSSGGDKPSPSQILGEVQRQVQVAQFQEFVSTVRDKCFEKCVTKPSSSLGSSEQQCLARCCDRYAEATQIVMRSQADIITAGLSATASRMISARSANQHAVLGHI